MTSRIYAPIILLTAALGGCNRSGKNQVEAATKAPDPIAVNVAMAEVRTLEKAISVTGSLNPDETVTVASEVPGRVIDINTDFGKTVHKGDIVAQIDPTEYRIQVDRTRAAFHQALARLGLKPGDENTPPTSTAMSRQAQAQLEDAKFKFESAAKLVKTGDVSQERFTELEKAYRARQAAFEASQDDLRTMWMSMESLRADVKLAEKRLNDTTIRAPFEGAIMQKHVSAGQYIKDNTPILTLVKTNPLRLRVEIPESATWSVHIGTPLSFNTDAAPGIEFHATVREMNPSLDSKNRTLTAEARLAENDARLRPGMFVQVRLVTEKAAPAVMVPKAALYNVAGLTKLFAVRNNRAVEFHIAQGREDKGWIEVPADQIHAGDQIAVSNVPQLINDSPVRLTTDH
jgi:RND family efflux transporter MFP subunit